MDDQFGTHKRRSEHSHPLRRLPRFKSDVAIGSVD